MYVTTNDIEQFTAPGKYYIDKFFEEVNKNYILVNPSKEIKVSPILKKPQNYQLKQYNKMQNK